MFASACAVVALPVDEPLEEWVRLSTEPARFKQDDFCFVGETGWYVNSLGKIFKTGDGGAKWTEVLDQPGTYWRSILFIDDRRGFAGNLGPGAVEGFKTVLSSKEWENLNREVKVTDGILVYETTDGGKTWAPSRGFPLRRGGICSMSASKGRLTVWAGGRVTGPALLARWTEAAGWESVDVDCGMVLDVAFQTERRGIVCAATGTDPATSYASILRTEDGGATWNEVYRSNRPGETVWKCSFPTLDVGYATIRSFSLDPAMTKQYLVKTVDGGRTWQEIVVVDDFASRPQGIAFLTADRGWVGTTTSGFETRDGGASWIRCPFGRNVNRIRIVPNPGGGTLVYALGEELHRLRLP